MFICVHPWLRALTNQINDSHTRAATNRSKIAVIGKRHQGQWQWREGTVIFVGLVIPIDLISKYIGPEDSAGGSTLPTIEITTWSLTLENHWGKLLFPVFPDSDINFRRVSDRSH